VRLSFRPYKFQLLQELKPNDRPHWRNFRTDMLNCPKEYNLFLDKTVSSDEVTFHLSGKVNRHNQSSGDHRIHSKLLNHRKMDMYKYLSS
jgi:hypothetical protein